MQIQLKMGPEFQKTLADLRGLGPAVSAATSRGLGAGAKFAAAHVVENYLSGQLLKNRSGMLAKFLTSWKEGPFDAVVGVRENTPVEKYKWLLGDEEKTITPKRSKFLAIPIGEALTGAGVAKYKSPRDVTDGFFIKSKSGKLLFGYQRGTRGKFRPLFVLVKSVLVQGSGALLDGVMDSVDDMTGAIQDAVDKAVEG